VVGGGFGMSSNQSQRKESQSSQWNRLLKGANLGQRSKKGSGVAALVHAFTPSLPKGAVTVSKQGKKRGRPKGGKQKAEADDDEEEDEVVVEDEAGEEEALAVPEKLRGTGLEYIQKQSTRDAEQEMTRKKPRGKKERTTDPSALASPVWVFFRSAIEGEDKSYVYCRAHGYKSQGKCTWMRRRVKISTAADGTTFLKQSNAVSHVAHCHSEWWHSTQDTASKGHDARLALDALLLTDTPLPRQSAISSVGKPGKHGGRFAKEVSLLLWMIRSRVAFNTLGDTVGMGPFLQEWGVAIRGEDTIKRLTFAVHEVAIRLAVDEIRAAGVYSITTDYWTAVNGKKFMSITFHWTDDDWIVRSQTLDLVPVDANATGPLTENVLMLRLNDHFGKRALWGEQVHE